MGYYAELNSLSLEELIICWYGLPLDQEEDSLYYDEVAFLICDRGEAGIRFLFNEIDKADTNRLGAILCFLPRPEHPVSKNILLPYLQDKRPNIVARAVHALQSQNERDSYDVVFALRDHSDPCVRGSVLRFMSKLYPELAPPFLLEALQDPHYIVREGAVDELDELPWIEAIPYILPLLSDPNSHVREAVETAIKNLEDLASIDHKAHF